MLQPRRGRIVTFVACALATVAIGCNSEPPKGSLAGTVTIDGEPLTDAMVAFYDTKRGKGVSCPLDASGMFIAPSDIEIGTYKVMIGPAGPVAAHQPGADGLPPRPTIEQRVPAKLRSYDTSDIVAEVESGENTYHFAIESR